MILGRVAGTVVCSARSDGMRGLESTDGRKAAQTGMSLRGPTFLLVEQCSTRGEPKGDWLVALDGVGAGTGEMVIVAQGPSARQTAASNQKPVDALVCGIVDLVDERGTIVFRKG